jgi:hypothetical protein
METIYKSLRKKQKLPNGYFLQDKRESQMHSTT